ncbi:hypothetical protein, partial [Cupriavidus necator]
RGRGAQAAARTIAPLARRVAATGPRAQSRNYGGHGVGCPHCGGRRMHVRGPVTIIVRGA